MRYSVMKAHHVLGNTVSIQKAKRPTETNFVTSDIKIIISNDCHSHMNMTFKIQLSVPTESIQIAIF